MTPRGWNHLKIIYSHVWCLGCDDSKARTADYSTHTRLDMWHEFLIARQPQSSQFAYTYMDQGSKCECSIQQKERSLLCHNF